MAEKSMCPICGEPTFMVYGKYPRKDGLCGPCSKRFMQKEIEQCPDCGKWHNTEESCTCKAAAPVTEAKRYGSDTPLPKKHFWESTAPETTESEPTSSNELTCIVCGEPSNGKQQCKNCYYESRSFIEILDKSSTVRAIRDYYYNLKERIVIIKTLAETQKQCNKLIAIAMLAKEVHDNSSLIDRVYKDVEILIKSKKTPVPNDIFEEERKEKDEGKGKINTAFDGHIVDSDMEVRIDDALYDSCILHCYGKSIEEIIERRKKCDWFIPILNGAGIYIEYWGMKTKKYLEERAEKEELYKKYDIPYISIEADDPKQDTLTFRTNLIRELTKLAMERYGFMPKWKK